LQATPEEIALLYQALAERDEDAWERAWAAWSPRVATWVRLHPQFRYTGEEVQYFVGRAFERLWRSINAEKLERFETPSHLIKYLKLCVHSSILDELRPEVAHELAAVASSESMGAVPDTMPGVESTVVERAVRDELWAIVNDCARTPQDQALVEASFVRCLPPREIGARYSGLFNSLQDVYRIKRNLLERLGRDPRLKDLAAGG
jgi:hypothetical protein